MSGEADIRSSLEELKRKLERHGIEWPDNLSFGDRLLLTLVAKENLDPIGSVSKVIRNWGSLYILSEEFHRLTCTRQLEVRDAVENALRSQGLGPFTQEEEFEEALSTFLTQLFGARSLTES